MSRADTTYIHQIDRLHDDGTAEPQTQIDTNVVTYFYSLRGTDDWETAERYLTDQFAASTWDAGRYRITVTRTSGGVTSPVTTVERALPLHPGYAKLPYNKSNIEPRLPVRAFIHRLVGLYPGSTMELVAEHFETFEAHYLALLSTADLAASTGYELPAGQQRPMSPYSDYSHLDEVPADKK